MNSYEEAKKKLDEYITTLEASPIQKSKEWYAVKQKTIGGSEVATVLGINPFKSAKSLVAEKAQILKTPFNGNIATRWGTLFEDVTRKWVEMVLSMGTIVETGSIEGCIKRQRYSPDGLGIVKFEDKWYIVLFEFKSPLRSLPDGKIPKYYLPQIKTGMITIPIVDTSIFVNNCYRKCLFKDIGFDVKSESGLFTIKFDNKFHPEKKRITKAQKITNVYACGMIFFYQTQDHYEKMMKFHGYDSDDEVEIEMSESPIDFQLFITSEKKAIDFGAENEDIINRLLELVEEKRILVKFSDIVANNSVLNKMKITKLIDKKDSSSVNTTLNPKDVLKTNYKEFIEDCNENNYIPVGYLPWKLLKSDIIKEERDDKWRDTIEKPINDILFIIDKLLEIPKEYREEAFNKIYSINAPDSIEIESDCNNLFISDSIDDEVSVDE
jgi:hypothetical protein